MSSFTSIDNIRCLCHNLEISIPFRSDRGPSKELIETNLEYVSVKEAASLGVDSEVSLVFSSRLIFLYPFDSKLLFLFFDGP